MRYAVLELQSERIVFLTNDPDAAATVALALDVADKRIAVYKMADARSTEFPMSFGDGTRVMRFNKAL